MLDPREEPGSLGRRAPNLKNRPKIAIFRDLKGVPGDFLGGILGQNRPKMAIFRVPGSSPGGSPGVPLPDPPKSEIFEESRGSPWETPEIPGFRQKSPNLAIFPGIAKIDDFPGKFLVNSWEEGEI